MADTTSTGFAPEKVGLSTHFRFVVPQAPGVRPGIAKKLRRHFAIREPEIAEMKR